MFQTTALILVLMARVAAGNQSQPPAANPPDRRESPKPSAVQRPGDASSDRREREPSTSLDSWLLVAFTGLLVVVGGLQVVALFRQQRFMNGQLRPTEDAAKAAQASVVLTHRPKLVVPNVVVPGLPTLDRTTPLHDIEPDLSGQFWLTNAGATRAHLE